MGYILMGYILVNVIGEVSTHGLCTDGCHWGDEYSQVTYSWVMYWWMSLGR